MKQNYPYVIHPGKPVYFMQFLMASLVAWLPPLAVDCGLMATLLWAALIYACPFLLTRLFGQRPDVRFGPQGIYVRDYFNASPENTLCLAAADITMLQFRQNGVLVLEDRAGRLHVFGSLGYEQNTERLLAECFPEAVAKGQSPVEIFVPVK